MLMEKSISVTAYSSICFVLWMTLGGGGSLISQMIWGAFLLLGNAPLDGL